MKIAKKGLLCTGFLFAIMLFLNNVTCSTGYQEIINLDIHESPVIIVSSKTIIIQQAGIDNGTPQLTDPIFSSATVESSETMTVVVTVTDTAGSGGIISGINRVYCQYSIDSSSWNTLAASALDNNIWSATIPEAESGAVVTVRFQAYDNVGNSAFSDSRSYTVNAQEYSFAVYLGELMDMSFNALRFIVTIIILALSVSFTVWWVLYVFKVFPNMLADLTGRIQESYGNIGVFIFIVLFFPSLLVFIIHFLTQNITLLTVALEGLIGDLIGDGIL